MDENQPEEQRGALQFPLTVSLTGMSDRTQALIEYYIDRSNNRYFAIGRSINTCDVILVDHDHPGTATKLATRKWRAGIPLIVLAVGDRQIDGAIMVRKPLDSAGLEKAAVSALEQLVNNSQIDITSQEGIDVDNDHLSNAATELPSRRAPAPAPVPEPEPEPEPDNSTNAADAGILPILSKVEPSASMSSSTLTKMPAYFRTDDIAHAGGSTQPSSAAINRYKAKIEQMCGLPRTLEQLHNPFNPDHRFDIRHCLSRRIASALAERTSDLKAVQYTLSDIEIYLLPTLGKVYTSVSLENKQNVDRVFRECKEADILVVEHYLPTVNGAIARLNEVARHSFGAHAFCWLGALFFAQGRLPVGLDIDSVCKLRHWPNMTRLELIPSCLEIAAAWADAAASLRQVVERVGCEPRYAASFLNAACTIDVMDINGPHGR